MPERVGTSRVVVALIGDKVYDARENFLHCGKRGIVSLIPLKANANCRAGGIDRARTKAVLDQLLCPFRGSRHMEHRCTLANSGPKCCAGRKSGAFNWPRLRGSGTSDKCLRRAPPQQKWQGKPHGRVVCQGNDPPAKTGCADLPIMITKNVIVAHGLYVCG